MPSPIHGLNAAQISQVASATTLSDATKMNLLNKIIDWFKGDVQYKALEHLFHKISVVKEAMGQSQRADFQEEKDRMDAFAGLRESALPEHRDKFKFSVVDNAEGQMECRIRIADVLIYVNKDIGGPQKSQERFDLMLGMYGMQLEDACRNDDDELLFAVLAKIRGEVQGMAPLTDDQEAQDAASMADNAQVPGAPSVSGAHAQRGNADDIVVEDEDDTEPEKDINANVGVTIPTVPQLAFAVSDKVDATSPVSVAGMAAVERAPQLETEAMKLVIQPLSTDAQDMVLRKLREKHDAPITGEMPDYVMRVLGTLTTSLEYRAEQQDEARLMFQKDSVRA